MNTLANKNNDMKTSLLVFLSLLLLCTLTACDLRFGSNEEADSEEHTLTKNIQANVQMVNTNISMKAGKLMVTGGAKDMMEADIKYSREAWKPQIYFSEDGQTGQLSIEQPDMSVDLNLNIDEDMNTWTIKLNDRIQQNFYCEIGAGQTDLDLRGMNFNRVRIDAGVGDHRINLKDTSVPEIEINAGVGQVFLDISGQWRNSLDAEIKGGIGELNLILPADAGIRLNVNGGLGDVHAPELNRNERTYTNDLYGKATHSLEINIKAGMGSIKVSLE